MELISVARLNVSLSGRDILKDISFELHSGETLVLMGKNGAGKSVLLKVIAGLIPGFSGDIRVKGKPVTSATGSVSTCSGGNPAIAYVFQKGGLFDSMNVFDNTAFGLRRMDLTEAEVEHRVLTSLERVGLKGSELKYPADLSGGMQKRVGLARAVCMEPEIILFDDPTAGLDPILSDSMADLILDITGGTGRAAIAVTNDIKVAEKIADRAALLFDGRFVFYGSGKDFFLEADDYSRQFIQGDVEGPIDAY